MLARSRTSAFSFINANTKTPFVVFLSLCYRGRSRTDGAPFDSIRGREPLARAADSDQHPARVLYPVDVSRVSSTARNKQACTARIHSHFCASFHRPGSAPLPFALSRPGTMERSAEVTMN